MFKSSSGWICTLCGYKSDRYKVTRHIEGKHGNTAGYKCSICNTVLKTEEARQAHMKQVHLLQITFKEIRQMSGENPM